VSQSCEFIGVDCHKFESPTLKASVSPEKCSEIVTAEEQDGSRAREKDGKEIWYRLCSAQKRSLHGKVKMIEFPYSSFDVALPPEEERQ
jgi:hypothetical protein